MHMKPDLTTSCSHGQRILKAELPIYATPLHAPADCPKSKHSGQCDVASQVQICPCTAEPARLGSGILSYLCSPVICHNLTAKRMACLIAQMCRACACDCLSIISPCGLVPILGPGIQLAGIHPGASGKPLYLKTRQ